MTTPSASTLTGTPDTSHRVPGASASTDTPSTPALLATVSVTRTCQPHPTTRPRLTTARDLAQDRAGQEGYWSWLDHVWPAAGCAAPVRLHGDLLTVDRGTGEIVGHRHTSTMPDGLIYKACGNRRAEVCPSCAETYRRDAYQLIRAGLVGGKSIPTDVATHPAVFATFTAPSFGPVHTRRVLRHICENRKSCTCASEPCRARRDRPECEHGSALSCTRRHRPDDPVLGKPLCLDCYDHDHQVLWNNQAGELWRRTKQAIERHVVSLARRRLGLRSHRLVDPDGTVRYVRPLRVSYAKAAEYQARGVVHFHALLRLDGTDPHDPDALLPPPAGVGVELLEDAITAAVPDLGFDVDHPMCDRVFPIGWGRQLDVRPVKLRGDGSITDSMVAGYLAKYATKSTETTGHHSRRLTPDTIRDHAEPGGGHIARLLAACWDLGAAPRWETMRRWAHMLGFGGHFLTKARRYSVTFGVLRHARIIWRRTEDPAGPGADPAVRAVDHDDDTTLVIGALTYAGTGWHTTSDALLANSAASRAREYAKTGREELEHDYATAAISAA